MENKVLLNIEIKYGFLPDQVNKLLDVAHMLEINDLSSEDFQKLVDFIVKNEIIQNASEEIIEEIKLKKLF